MNMQKLGRFANLLEPMPCIGLAYIAGALEAHGVEVRAVYMFADKLSGPEVVERVTRYKPDIVGFTVLTPSAPICAELSAMVREAVPGVKIVWGAVHAEVFARDIVRQGEADFVVHHDGEITICELVDALADKKTDFSHVDGLTWRGSDGEAVTNKDRVLNRDLDDLPYRPGTSSPTTSTACSPSPTSPSPCSPWPAPGAARTAATTAPCSTRAARSTVAGTPSRSPMSTSSSWTATA